MTAQLLATATAVKSGSTVTATVNGVATTVQVARDLAVVAGDVLVVSRIGAEWFALARVFAGPTTAQPVEGPQPPEPKPTSTTGALVVSPVETRSYRAGGWRTDTDDVLQGAFGGWGNHTGAVFYGAKPRSLAGAVVLGASVRVRRDAGGAYAATPTTMRLMTEATRPAGAPALTLTTAGPSLAVGASTSWAVPTAWVDALVAGTAGGIAFFDGDGAPYVRFAGRASWSPAFTLTISWRRS